jgi:hypothetical protein
MKDKILATLLVLGSISLMCYLMIEFVSWLFRGI